MESEAINMEGYLGCELGQRFEFLYENYSVIKLMIRDYKEDIISDVVEMKTYNRRKANGDLGVRIQVRGVISRPTENQAIRNNMLETAIDGGVLDEEFFEDTDDQEDLIRRVTLYRAVSTDFAVFKRKLNTMDPRDQRILKPYLLRQKSLEDLSVEMGIEYRSAIQRIYRIKKKLSSRVMPDLQRGA